MASPVPIDLDAFLRPISEESPSGTDLRQAEDSLFIDFKDAKRSASKAERMLSEALIAAQYPGEDQARSIEEARRKVEEAWNSVQRIAPRLLSERSKDLEVAAIWMEGLTREFGFAGLHAGIKLTRSLVETYWDTLHPRPDEQDGFAARCRSLEGLNGDGPDGPLPTRIGMLPVTEAIDERGGFSTWHYGQARELTRVTDPEQRAAREQAGAVSMEAFLSAVASTSDEQLRHTLEDIEQALAEWESLSRAIAERSAGYSPPSSAVRDALSAAADTLRFCAKERLGAGGASEAGDGAKGAERGSSGLGAAGGKGGPVGAINSREDALRVLRLAAEYLRRTEPHSPISYGIEQCVRWGAMSLPELLRELLADEGARSQLFLRVGIRDETPPQ